MFKFLLMSCVLGISLSALAEEKVYVCGRDVVCGGIGLTPKDIVHSIIKNDKITETISILANNKKYLEVSIKNGKIDGLMREYGTNGFLQKETPFKKGKVDGIEKSYDMDGQLISEIPYSLDKENGVSKLYKNGHLMGEISYKNGEREGLTKYYSLKGLLTEEIPYTHNKKNGTEKLYYDDGKIKKEIFYENDEERGISKTYYQNGFLGSEFNHDTNEIKNFVYYLQNGKIIKKNILRKKINPNDWNVIEAIFESYDADDNLKIRRKAKEEDFIREAEPIGFEKYIENPIIRIP